MFAAKRAATTLVAAATRCATRAAKPSAQQGVPAAAVMQQHMTKRGMAEMPVPQSAKAVLFEGHQHVGNEGWESTIAWWYPTSFVLICCVLGLEPETGIDAWAKKEAAARLAMKDAGFAGEFVFGKHYQSLSDEDLQKEWDKHSNKAVRMTDDDDDDEEEDEEDDDDDDDE